MGSEFFGIFELGGNHQSGVSETLGKDTKEFSGVSIEK
jgi:hypothetical protein